MKPLVLRLAPWVATEKPWLVITARSCGSFATWDEAISHATRIA